MIGFRCSPSFCNYLYLLSVHILRALINVLFFVCLFFLGQQCLLYSVSGTKISPNKLLISFCWIQCGEGKGGRERTTSRGERERGGRKEKQYKRSAVMHVIGQQHVIVCCHHYNNSNKDYYVYHYTPTYVYTMNKDMCMTISYDY